MLVLSRKKDRTIVINGGVKIKVLGVRGNTVRLGIQAPDDVVVMRGELDEWQEFSFEPAETQRLGGSPCLHISPSQTANTG